jgi:hypothetical protein
LPALDAKIEKKVKDFWASWKANNPGKHISRRAFHRLYSQRVSNTDIGLSRFNQIVRELETAAPPEPFPLVEWEPWRSDNVTPGTSAFLLTMDAVCQAVQYRRLYRHEASWGMKLRVALQGLTPYDQFCFVTHYAIRQVRAYYSKEEEPFSIDLDAILAYKPWLPENIHAFRMVALARPDSLGNWVLTGRIIRGLFPSFTWEEISSYLLLPWHIEPVRGEPRTSQELKEFQAADAALRFWMGSDPLFLPPLGHEDLGLPDLTQPVINRVTWVMDYGHESDPRYRTETREIQEHSNTYEEDEQ